MNTQLSTLSPKVSIHDDKVITTTEDVANYFGKQHHHVVQKLESLECSEEFIIRNFSRMIKNVQLPKGAEREVIYYEMTKDGFIFLVMGFTGKKAAAFKEAYISEFNRMERELNKPSREIAKTTTEPSEREKLAYYAAALTEHFEVIYEVWRDEVRPALRALKSPVLVRLNDRFTDGSIHLMFVKKGTERQLQKGEVARIC